MEVLVAVRLRLVLLLLDGVRAHIHVLVQLVVVLERHDLLVLGEERPPSELAADGLQRRLELGVHDGFARAMTHLREARVELRVLDVLLGLLTLLKWTFEVLLMQRAEAFLHHLASEPQLELIAFDKLVLVLIQELRGALICKLVGLCC